MPFTYHQAIDKAKIESKLMAIFREEIHALQTVGFGDLAFVREVLFPLSAVFAPLVWLESRKRRDIWQITGQFQIVHFNPLLLHWDWASYGHIMDMGVTLVTSFEDGSALISVNYPCQHRPKPEIKIHFQAMPTLSIAAVWEKHLAKITELEALGNHSDADLSLEKYTRIIQDLYKVALLGMKERKNGD